jgi:hypothetical protein
MNLAPFPLIDWALHELGVATDWQVFKRCDFWNRSHRDPELRLLFKLSIIADF